MLAAAASHRATRRLDEIRVKLEKRIVEATRNAWFVEIEGLDVSYYGSATSLLKSMPSSVGRPPPSCSPCRSFCFHLRQGIFNQYLKKLRSQIKDLSRAKAETSTFSRHVTVTVVLSSGQRR